MLNYKYVNHIFNKYFEVSFELHYDLGYWSMLFNRYEMQDSSPKCEGFVKLVKESVNDINLSKVKRRLEEEDRETQIAMLSFADNAVFYVALRNNNYSIFLLLLKSADISIIKNVLAQKLEAIIKKELHKDDPYTFNDKVDMVRLLPAEARAPFLTYDYSNLLRHACEEDCSSQENNFKNVFMVLDLEPSVANRNIMIKNSNDSSYITTKGFNDVVLSAMRKGGADVVVKLLSYTDNPDIAYQAIIAIIKDLAIDGITKSFIESYSNTESLFRRMVEDTRKSRKSSEQVSSLLAQPSISEQSFAGGAYGVLPEPAALASSRPAGVLDSQQDLFLLASSSCSSTFGGNKKNSKRPRVEGGQKVGDGSAKKNKISEVLFGNASDVSEQDSIFSCFL